MVWAVRGAGGGDWAVPYPLSYNCRVPSTLLRRRYLAACATEPSYPEVGATRAAALPSGYSWLRRRIHLGRGPAVLNRAGAYVLGWGTQLGTGFAVYPPSAQTEAGATVLLRIALPGHPECGEESFVVTMDAAGDVWFEVTAFSRLAAWYARLCRPVAALLQHLAIERYLRVVARAAAAG